MKGTVGTRFPSRTRHEFRELPKWIDWPRDCRPKALRLRYLDHKTPHLFTFILVSCYKPTASGIEPKFSLLCNKTPRLLTYNLFSFNLV